MNSVDFNVLAAAGRDAAELLEAKLEAAYLAAYRAAGRDAAKAFRARAEPVVAAADPHNPGWSKPEPSELSNDEAVAAAMEKKTRAARKLMLQAISAQLVGIDFDVTSPFAAQLLDRLRFQENRAVEIRERVALAVDDAYQEGLSVADTAKAIRETVFEIAPARAATLARTDLNGVSNGANLLAAKAAGVGGFKRWLTAEDDRVREMHVEADGQTVGIDELFDVCDTTMAYPGDPDGPGECVFNCRCALVFVDSIDAQLVSNVPEPITSAADVPLTGGSAMKTDTAVAASAVTITVDQPTDDAPAEVALAWVSDIAFEGAATEDGRYILPGALSWRTPPLTLMALIETGPGGHEGAEAAGRMDEFVKDADFDMDGVALPEDVTAVRATGVFDSGEYGVEIARMVDERTVRGVSVDLAILAWCFRDPDTGELIEEADMDEDDWERAWFGELQFAIKEASIMAATVCPTPAFADARIARTASGEMTPVTVWAPLRIVTDQPEPRTASAAGKVPDRPPVGWFEIPETDFACPLIVEDDGRVYGHLADWTSCHVGLPGCETPPRSPSGYAYFHTGEIETDEGVRIAVGKLMLGSPHAQVRDGGGNIVGAAEASKHYDDNAFVGAYVRAHDGQYGIWVSGTLRPDLPEDRIRDFQVNPPSGDWRPINGALELIAGLAVPVPGHPLPRNYAGITASADGSSHVEALIAFGLNPADYEEHLADRQIRVLAARAEGGIDGLAELALAETV